MIKHHKWKLLISSILILLPCLFGIIFWDKLPEQMAIHWSADGNADGFSGPLTVVLILPLILLAFQWLCIFITLKDPKNQGQTKAFGIVFWIVPFISLFANAIIYSSAFGKDFNINFIMPVFLGLMFVILGNYMPKFRQNYTMGIKIKWTLQNEENWNATHRFCAKLWVIGGLLMTLIAFLDEKIMIWGLLVIIIPMVIAPIIYSYSYHKKQVKNGTATVNPLPEFRHGKTIKIFSLIIVAIILVFACFITFTGEITVNYNKNSFTVDSSFWSELTVDYDAIDSIEYREKIEKGTRTNGLSTLRLLAGIFRNDEFGNYTLYSYTKCESGVIIESDGKILVISGKDNDSTKVIYDKLSKIK